MSYNSQRQSSAGPSETSKERHFGSRAAHGERSQGSSVLLQLRNARGPLQRPAHLIFLLATQTLQLFIDFIVVAFTDEVDVQ